MAEPFITWTTCQPPSPSGMLRGALRSPLVTVAEPRDTELKAQHVLSQFTRLPTTVDQTSRWVPLVSRPVTCKLTLVSTGPWVLESVATALLLGSSPAVVSVVT